MNAAIPNRNDHFPLRNIAPVILCCLLFAAFAGNALPVNGDAPDVFSIDREGEKVTLDIKEMPVAELVERINFEAGIEIRGLMERRSGRVTFTHTGRSLEDVLRQLLRYLDETNFIYQYEDDRLTRITVLPTGEDEAPVSQRESDWIDLAPKTTVVEIVDVLEESQAESVGLKKGDYIYQYGSRRMYDSQTLIKETDRKDDSTTVEMIVIRNGDAKSFFLERGFIGVQVRTRILRLYQLPKTLNEFGAFTN